MASPRACAHELGFNSTNNMNIFTKRGIRFFSFIYGKDAIVRFFRLHINFGRATTHNNKISPN